MANVEIMCKTRCKPMRISRVKFCIKILFKLFSVKNSIFPPRFQYFSTTFPTNKSPLLQPSVFHLFTTPTTTTTKNLIINN